MPRALALSCIKVYRHAISPLLPPSCRYVPTCSEYALIAFERFGFWRGLWLSVRRVGRCHPLAKGGYDPVPMSFSKKLA
ncbi:MAG: membrane protein insertion efficiency factor YidD [Coriobacteriales bacterium]|nr:membrane protein insertion efficiency factor YidD [Coriobacteriales bacterium]